MSALLDKEGVPHYLSAAGSLFTFFLGRTDPVRNFDQARDQYVRRLYRISVDDPEVFQLQIDSTAIPLEACADIIVAAYRALTG